MGYREAYEGNTKMKWFKKAFTKLTDNWFSRTRKSIDVPEFPIRQDITVLPADDPKKLRLGWVIYEEVGMVIINDYAVARVQVEADKTPPYIYPELRTFRS